VNVGYKLPSNLTSKGDKAINWEDVMPYVETLLNGERKQIVIDYGNDDSHYSLVWTLLEPPTGGCNEER